MNVFCVDSDPCIAAQQLCDKHVVKMITESVQMLALGFSLDRLAASDCPRTKNNTPRLHAYAKHPCSQWVLASSGNYQWLLDHTQAMIEEHQRRYPTSPRHFGESFVKWASKNIFDTHINHGDKTQFAIAINDESLCRQHVPNFNSLTRIDQYRYFYIYDKSFAAWKVADSIPMWYIALRKKEQTKYPHLFVNHKTQLL
jgi:hypothetical protein